MSRLKIIFNLVLGKDIVIYNTWTKEVLAIIGNDEEILKKRYSYDFISQNSDCLYGNDETGKIYYKGEY